MSYIISPNILRKYDIRGIVGEDLHYEDAYFIGKSLGVIFLKEGISKISLGRDGRNSSLKMFENLSKGLLESGIDIIYIGLVSSPCLYYSVHKLNLDAGVMITASHNPKEYNGFKVYFQKRSFFGDDILEIGKISAKGNFINSKKPGKIEEIDIKNDYVNEIYDSMLFEKSEKDDDILWLIDGGVGHSGIVDSVLKNEKLDIPFICISKGENRNASEEEFHTKTQKNIKIDNKSDVFHYLQRLRDEVHNYAISNHRFKRNKDSMKSILDEIQGIGTKRKRALLKHFGSIDLIKKASMSDLMQVDGISKNMAESITSVFQE